jgi:hypothetical protein
MIEVNLAEREHGNAVMAHSCDDWYVALGPDVAVVEDLHVGVRVVVDGPRAACVRGLRGEAGWNLLSLQAFVARALGGWFAASPDRLRDLMQEQFARGVEHGRSEAQAAVRRALGMED